MDDELKKAALKRLLSSNQMNQDLEEQRKNAIGTDYKAPSLMKAVDSTFTAPLRSGIAEAQQGNFGQILPAMGHQFAQDPKTAPSWEDLGKNAGISDKPIANLPLVGKVSPLGMYSETMGMTTDPLMYLNPSQIGAGVGSVERRAIPRTMTQEQQKEILGELPDALKHTPEYSNEIATPESLENTTEGAKQARLERLKDLLEKRRRERSPNLDEPTNVIIPKE